MTELEFLDRIMDKVDSNVRILPASSGLIDTADEEIFYNVIFVQRCGRFKPIVVNSKGDILEVIDNTFNELSLVDDVGKPKYKKPNQVPEDLRFHYFVYKNYFYNFTHNLNFNGSLGINTVNNYVIHDIRNNKRYSQNIFTEITDEIQKYYHHDSPYEYDIMASAILSTYIYEILGRVFYLILLGRKSSGKTVALELLSHLSFNGLFGGKGTVPSSCRLINLYGITLCQDEFEKMSKDEKTMFVGIFNSGFNRSGTYRITNMGTKDISKQVYSMRTFCPKFFTCNSTEGFDITFLDRCYIIHSVKTDVTTKDIHQLKNEDYQRFQMIRNQNFLYCLFNWKQIISDINYVKSKLEGTGVFGRESDKNSIILGIIKHFKGEQHAIKVRNYLQEKIPLMQFEKTRTMEEIILKAIVEMYSGKYVPIIKIENLYLFARLWQGLGFKSPRAKFCPSNQKPRNILNDLGLLTKKSNLGYNEFGRRVFLIDTEKLRSVLTKEKYENILEELPPQAPQAPQTS